MKAELIDYTGMGMADPMWAAKKLVYIKSTRLERSKENRDRIFNELEGDELQSELDYIVNTIRSSWEFVHFNWDLTGASRACVDQILRTRHGSYAVQAMRVVDMGSFGYVTPPTVRGDPEALVIWDDHMKETALVYQALQRRGIPNQDCRGVIPMNAETNATIEWNLRTFVDIVGKRENLRAQGEYQDVVRELKRTVYEVMPWVKSFCEPDRLKTPALIEILTRELGNAGPLDKPLLNQALKEVDMLKAVWG
jgi:flavin-dependent thymidylate synthase